MIKPLPKEGIHPAIKAMIDRAMYEQGDSLDNLKFHSIKVNPPKNKGPKFGTNKAQAAICNRCNMRVSFFSLRNNETEEETKKDKQFVRNAITEHIRNFHTDENPKGLTEQQLRDRFVLINVDI